MGGCQLGMARTERLVLVAALALVQMQTRLHGALSRVSEWPRLATSSPRQRLAAGSSGGAREAAGDPAAAAHRSRGGW